jgi:hypothetical protein
MGHYLMEAPSDSASTHPVGYPENIQGSPAGDVISSGETTQTCAKFGKLRIAHKQQACVVGS